MRLVLDPAAEADIAQVAAFYETTVSPALAARFVAEFKRVSELLMEFPGLGAPRSRGRRGFRTTSFPYTVIYRAAASEITVLVVKHDARRPRYGGSRV